MKGIYEKCIKRNMSLFSWSKISGIHVYTEKCGTMKFQGVGEKQAITGCWFSNFIEVISKYDSKINNSSWIKSMLYSG